jgi:hypothetical protein
MNTVMQQRNKAYSTPIQYMMQPPGIQFNNKNKPSDISPNGYVMGINGHMYGAYQTYGSQQQKMPPMVTNQSTSQPLINASNTHTHETTKNNKNPTTSKTLNQHQAQPPIQTQNLASSSNNNNNNKTDKQLDGKDTKLQNKSSKNMNNPSGPHPQANTNSQPVNTNSNALKKSTSINFTTLNPAKNNI